MGAVYMAERERPIRRKVGLKIIRLGMDTRQIIARLRDLMKNSALAGDEWNRAFLAEAETLLEFDD